MILPGRYLLADTGAFVLVVLLTGAMRRVALRYGVVDWPGKQKAHAGPTPYLGGVAIAFGALAATGLAAPPFDPRILALLAAAVAMLLLGLLDDLKPLGVGVRVAVECTAAALVVAAGARIGIIGRVPGLGYWPDIIITLMWIVLMTNSFNLLDNSDGAAGGIAVVTSAALAAMAFGSGWESLGVVQLALSAGCAGFLVYNWAPAKIFMGDAGSLFLGFVLSASAALLAHSSGPGPGRFWIVRICGLLLLTFVAAVDTSTVVLSRRRAGRSVVQGGTDHTAHRLRALGFGTSGAAALLSAGAGLSCAAGLLVVFGSLPAAVALAVTIAIGISLVGLAQRVRV